MSFPCLDLVVCPLIMTTEMSLRKLVDTYSKVHANVDTAGPSDIPVHTRGQSSWYQTKRDDQTTGTWRNGHSCLHGDSPQTPYNTPLAVIFNPSPNPQTSMLTDAQTKEAIRGLDCNARYWTHSYVQVIRPQYIGTDTNCAQEYNLAYKLFKSRQNGLTGWPVKIALQIVIFRSAAKPLY